MGEVYFYHLTRTPLEATLPMLLGKALEAGWRVAVRGNDRARVEWLDNKLWSGDGFLPHGCDGGPYDADQPILLTAKKEPANAANCLVSVDGADVEPTEIEAMTRVMILFDGNDDVALSHARGQWKVITQAGSRAKYWSQESGKWEMKAEAG